jgi:hypothetical protein
MNERIKELAEQSKLIGKGDLSETAIGQELDLAVAKFAELIVKDCISIVDGKNMLPFFDNHVASEPEDPVGKGWWKAQESFKVVIKNHFGMTE